MEAAGYATVLWIGFIASFYVSAWIMAIAAGRARMMIDFTVSALRVAGLTLFVWFAPMYGFWELFDVIADGY